MGGAGSADGKGGNGGFGGGGGGSNPVGGGGGYSGGGGGSFFGFSEGGGGGSWYDTTFVTNVTATATQAGDGSVTIEPATTATPEPSSLVLLTLGGVSFAVYGWRRRKQAEA
jgi:hypothetical protein